MQARDAMTSDVDTVGPATSAECAAEVMTTAVRTLGPTADEVDLARLFADSCPGGRG